MKSNDMNIKATIQTTFLSYEMIGKRYECHVALLTKLTSSHGCVHLMFF